MKRIIVCTVLAVFTVAVSCYAYIRVENLGDGLNARIDSLVIALKSGDAEEITKRAHILAEYWDGEESILVHLIRHSYIDTVTASVARLPALAEYGDYSEMYAELMNIRRQMEHIRDSEVLTFKNLM